MRETIEIVKLAFRGEKLAYQGVYHKLPLPGGEGKALRLSQPGNDRIPIYLATLGPKALEYTGEVADGWLGTSFTPEQAKAHLDYIRKGIQTAGRSISDIDIQAGGVVAFGSIEPHLQGLKQGLAFSLGAMGSAKTNFYNDAYKRGGYDAIAREIQALWVSGKRQEAVVKVPDDMVLQTNLLGDEAEIKNRLLAYRNAGVTTLRLTPAGENVTERLDTLGRTIELIKKLDY